MWKILFFKNNNRRIKRRRIPLKDILFIDLDTKEYKNLQTPMELEKVIDSLVVDDDFKYLFIDEVQNIEGFETVMNAYKEEENFSIFLTGSNSYLLSGELATKLMRRHIELLENAKIIYPCE